MAIMAVMIDRLDFLNCGNFGRHKRHKGLSAHLYCSLDKISSLLQYITSASNKTCMHIQVLINAVHHDPEIYADPELFKPERWLEGTPEYAADKQVILVLLVSFYTKLVAKYLLRLTATQK